MDTHEVVVWIVITAFTAVTVITILGLIQKIDIKPGYMKVLFTEVILGLVAGFIYLFYQGDKVTINPELTEYYVYDKYGEPVDFTVTQNDSLLIKSGIRKSNGIFRNIERPLALRNDTLFIRTARGNYLGFINPFQISALSAASITTEEKLYLGLYYSENHYLEPGYGLTAVKFLTSVIKTSDKESEKVKGVKGLYNVVNYISEEEDFELLIAGLNNLFASPTRFYEMAETYRVYYEKTGTARDKKYFGAFINYLRYLINEKRAETENPVIKQKLNQVKANMKYYGSIINNKIPLLAEEKLVNDIDTYNRQGLKEYYEKLRVVIL